MSKTPAGPKKTAKKVAKKTVKKAAKKVAPAKPVGPVASPDAYLAALPEPRRKAVEAIRETIRKNLPKGYAEGMQYGMIGYFVPHDVYPLGYHCDPKQPLPFASIASQKNHVGLYLFCIYMQPALQEWFASEWTKNGRKLDMGKGCIRIKDSGLDDIPLKLISQAVKKVPAKKFIEVYEQNLPESVKKKRAKAAGQ